MKRIILAGTLIAAMTCSNAVLAAQTTQAGQPGQAAKPAQAAQPTAQDQAVGELMKLMGIEQSMGVALAQMSDAMIQANPGLAQFRDVILEWAKKYVSWEAIEPKLKDAYKDAFSESELRDLIVFYKTPAGQKMLQKAPELMQKGMVIGSELAQSHTQELQTMITERLKEIEAKKKP